MCPKSRWCLFHSSTAVGNNRVTNSIPTTECYLWHALVLTTQPHSTPKSSFPIMHHQQYPSVLLHSHAGTFQVWMEGHMEKQSGCRAFSNSAPNLWNTVLQTLEKMYFLNSLWQTPVNSSVLGWMLMWYTDWHHSTTSIFLLMSLLGLASWLDVKHQLTSLLLGLFLFAAWLTGCKNNN